MTRNNASLNLNKYGNSLLWCRYFEIYSSKLILEIMEQSLLKGFAIGGFNYDFKWTSKQN